MKYAKLIGLVLILLSACKTKQASESEKVAEMFTGCPPNGECNVERIENSQVRLYEDTTGQFYPRTEDSDKFHLYKITYNRKVDERIMDAQYQEVIYFQIEKDKKSKQLIDKALEEANVIYGRLCFCGGNTGYERVLAGSLNFETTAKATEINMQIVPERFPILMNQIEAKVSF